MRNERVHIVDRRLKLYDTFEADPETEKTPPGDAVDAFAAETSSSSFVRPLKPVRGDVAASPLPFAPPLTTKTRGYLIPKPKLIAGAISVAAVLLALVVVGRMLGESGTVSSPPVSVTSSAGEQASETVEPVTPNSASATSGLTPRRATAGADQARRTTVREQRLPDGNGDPSAIPTQTTQGPAARDATQSLAGPTEAAPTPQPARANAVAVGSPDGVVYSDKDRDVRPPQMMLSELPRPAFAAWTTRTNAMEVVVSENGSVEHVRLLSPPQRMPDMMLLSRAKLWKFQPAVKDGRPVRYRVVLTWRVNP